MEKRTKLIIVVAVVIAVAIVVACFFLFYHQPEERKVVQMFKAFNEEFKRKSAEGYDVSEAEKYARMAKRAFRRGEYALAREYLEMAFEALRNAQKYEFPTFAVTRSNTWITDPVTLYDFVPFGVAFEKLPDNRIVIDRKQGWTASNFVAFGMAYNENHTIIFHSSVNIGAGWLRLMFDDKRICMKLDGPSYYDSGGKYFPYPTVYTNPDNDYVIIIAYDEANRTWYHKIIYMKTEPPTEILYVKGAARLVPLWIGKAEGPFVVHGIAGVRGGQLCLDTWGGYLDFEELIECSYFDLDAGKKYEFDSGFTFMDREYHRNLPIGSWQGLSASSLVDGTIFNAMSFHNFEGEVIEFLFLTANNPLPEDIRAKYEFPDFEHIGRINFVSRNESYRFDDFTFWTDGKLQPEKYYISGNFTDEEGKVVGTVNLTAEAYAYWGRCGAENWLIHEGTFWDPAGQTAWGRSFVLWHGTITIGEETIYIENARGFGEFQRYKPAGHSAFP